MAEQTAFDKTELRAVFKALKNMDEQAVNEAKRQSGALAEYARKEVIAAASGLQSRAVASRVAEGSKVKKSSRIGEITYGFAAQKVACIIEEAGTSDPRRTHGWIYIRGSCPELKYRAASQSERRPCWFGSPLNSPRALDHRKVEE